MGQGKRLRVLEGKAEGQWNDLEKAWEWIRVLEQEYQTLNDRVGEIDQWVHRPKLSSLYQAEEISDGTPSWVADSSPIQREVTWSEVDSEHLRNKVWTLWETCTHDSLIPANEFLAQLEEIRKHVGQR